MTTATTQQENVEKRPARAWRILLGFLLLLSAAGNYVYRRPGISGAFGAFILALIPGALAVWLISSGLPKSLPPGHGDLMKARRRIWFRLLGLGFLATVGLIVLFMLLSFYFYLSHPSLSSFFLFVAYLVPFFLFWYGWTWIAWIIAARKADREVGPYKIPYLAIKSSGLRYIVLLLGAVGFVAGGVVRLFSGGPQWIGWMMIIFFGSGIPLFIWKILDRRPRLKIDDAGIVDRTLGIDKILWEDIDGAYKKALQGNDFICLKLRNQDRYLAQLSPVKKALVKANESLGFTPILLNLSGLAANTDQILELILKTAEARQKGYS